jgi:arsenite methyltransferase
MTHHLPRGKHHDAIRASVAKDYAKAVKKKAGCCSSCAAKPVPKGVAAKLAGYSDDEFAALPAEAIVNSFGCGNPTSFIDVVKGDTVLDLGSGAGIDLLLAARKVGPSGKVIGIDMTDAMITKARQNIAAASIHNAEVRKGLIEDLPVESDSIDWVISNCVINLSPEKGKVFAEIARVLKPGGKMLVSDIVAEHLPVEIIMHPDLYSSCLSGAISEKNYILGLQEAGMADIEVLNRLVYDREQLTSFVNSELQAGATSRKMDHLIDQLVDKVWSIKIRASKSKKK